MIIRDSGRSGSLNTLALTSTGLNAAKVMLGDDATSLDRCVLNRAPSGCLQYLTGANGRFTTFNYDSVDNAVHLATQNYNTCIRQEQGLRYGQLGSRIRYYLSFVPTRLGMCCINYRACEEDDEDSFTLSQQSTAKKVALTEASCSSDYIFIEGEMMDKNLIFESFYTSL